MSREAAGRSLVGGGALQGGRPSAALVKKVGKVWGEGTCFGCCRLGGTLTKFPPKNDLLWARDYSEWVRVRVRVCLYLSFSCRKLCVLLGRVCGSSQLSIGNLSAGKMS